MYRGGCCTTAPSFFSFFVFGAYQRISCTKTSLLVLSIICTMIVKVGLQPSVGRSESSSSESYSYSLVVLIMYISVWYICTTYLLFAFDFYACMPHACTIQTITINAQKTCEGKKTRKRGGREQSLCLSEGGKRKLWFCVVFYLLVGRARRAHPRRNLMKKAAVVSGIIT